MSRKSAFQVYTESQTMQRHARAYRTSSTDSYKSPPHHTNARSSTTEWTAQSDVRQTRRASSPNSPLPAAYRDYDRRRSGSYTRSSRYSPDSPVQAASQARYKGDQYSRQDYDRAAGAYSSPVKEDYERRDSLSDGKERLYRQYSNEDLRQTSSKSQYAVATKDHNRWSTDEEYDYTPARKRRKSADSYRSSSSRASSHWSDKRRYSVSDHKASYSDYDSDHRRRSPSPAREPAAKKKKMKKSKEKKSKVEKSPEVVSCSQNIQSLMDVKIPHRVKQLMDLSTENTTTSASRYDSRTNTAFAGSSRDQDTDRDRYRNTARDRDQYDSKRSRYNDSSRSRYNDRDDDYRSRYSRDTYARDSSYDRRSADRNGKSSRTYSSRRSPSYDRKTYRHSDDRYRRRSSYSRDTHNNSESKSGSKRKRQSSVDRRDYQRGRNGGRGRSSDRRAYSDSDQDSDREGRRRSWRDERRQPKRKDDKEKDRNSRSKTTDAKSEKQEEKLERLQVITCDKGLAVLLTHPLEVFIRGRASVLVLAGEMSIMGYTLNAKTSKQYDVFSPAVGSHLTIKTTQPGKKQTLRKCLSQLGVDEQVKKESLKSAVLFLATPLLHPALDYVCYLSFFTQAFRYGSDKPLALGSKFTPEPGQVGAVFHVNTLTSNSFKTSEETEKAVCAWRDLVVAWRDKLGAAEGGTSVPVVLVCGGVNSGKSSLSRLLVNNSLSIIKKVCYLDCDVGQPEFSPPGSVALTVVDSPVFGPPFCHPTPSKSMCFFGMVNPGEGPTRYVQCVQHVYRAYQQMPDPPPLIVNTMGWNEGIGLQLFVDILRLLTPDLLVQIDMSVATLNFPPVTPDFPATQHGYCTEPLDEELETSRKKHEHLTITSIATQRTDLKVAPKNLRDMCLLSHLILGLSPLLTLTSAAPYLVPWKGLAVHLCHCYLPRNRLIHALNSAVVALCRAPDISQARRLDDDSPLQFDETPVCECLGYGLVRAVDHQKQALYIVTGVAPHRLAQVNTLLRGSITIHDQIFLKQQSYIEDVAYIDALERGSGPASLMAPIRPRSRMPRRN